MWLVDIARGQQFRPLGPHVCDLRHTALSNLLLDPKIPLLNVRRAEIPLERERRRRHWHRKVLRKWIVQEQRQTLQRKVQLEIEIRCVEVEPLARGQSALVVIDSIACAKY